mmetsp:Transcript_9223/g.10683  ORF Transcript_9223/g.10683 Transcript_9223/m.10683 type:complete len:552 (+) Transcript_9223:67-1722(+)|eukprot:CAMPEP_0204831226 /NCGR_PEP_ID=MMETSP1346-20131115/10155_1 /ASSEMBLY_ACC=CAM_ASM_000771 /TAXON_ID=215587 /ORGANISM="Aplanochytrium stocchinoi, Strain GSBS06" /LENGTH=551 /DNA_ID=CAMNT_0051962077 /DNA_START=63 /DNA_END=1718 /DNA_ORIENTATION=+
MSGLNFNLGAGSSSGAKPNGNTRDGMVEAWEKYLVSLKDSDPEEYKALMADLENEVKQSHVISSNTEKKEEAFNPVLPGGSSVMGETGIEVKKESLRVFPEPAFVIKTKDHKGEKIFINICKSELIQKTSTKKHLADDGSEQEGMNVPLSLGPPRLDKDKSGSDCLVYDIIVNPEIIEQINEDKTGATRNFLCELGIQYVEQKYKCKLDPRFKLPKMRYKGDVKNIPHQLIRKNNAPVIEEVKNEKTNTTNINKITDEETKNKPKRLEPISYKLERRYPGGKTVARKTVLQTPRTSTGKSDKPVEEKVNNENNALIFTANMSSLLNVDVIAATPKLPKGKEDDTQLANILRETLKVSISQELVSIKAQRVYKSLEVFLPEVICVEESLATFDAASGILTLVLPVELDTYVAESWMHSTNPDPGSRPWLLANAVVRDETTMEQRKDMETTDKAQDDREDPDTLPEDRFHLQDMLSMHIKEEREKNRQLKETEQEKKEMEQKEKEKEEKRKKMEMSKIKLLEEVEAELQKGTKEDVGIVSNEAEDATNILELF